MAPIDRDVLEKELTPERFVKKTNKGDNDIYIVNYHNAPNVLKEIGRLRELSFSQAGGGTGKDIDLDKFDTSENCYEQLIVYDREDREIVSGYRFKDCSTAISPSGEILLSTKYYFNFSDKFIKEYLPYTIELGRSWVQPLYQAGGGSSRKGIFALDNIWDGLGSIIINYPHIKYFFGKVTMYSSYNKKARNALLYFMNSYFPDLENLVTPIHPIEINTDLREIKRLIRDKNFDEGLKSLYQYLKSYGESVPPLINTYMKISDTMKSFGTAINPDFGGVEETAILVTIDDIYPEKKERHISS
ncbi:MAG: GNAT family N-acetyltransferase [Flavobacteriales bacterium]|nr:GNAT family N-acetyltransferase [Flavobacteriales bacterium]MCW8913643.1 GNAT family N-acetyltransferase [Flavobacteriales bacterium]MCW8937147.1 GNAT family N-acetyltransferase [Flavobacteriales bacterium]MCW8941179.1 GNAT family N-acetyltransferase [Flavobacteriales bacterium]MCW8968657.1 GNAT family N-acetyltransferase [Flavobacteriales bacterium]